MVLYYHWTINGILLLFSKDELLRALVPQDDADENNAILELRAGM